MARGQRSVRLRLPPTALLPWKSRADSSGMRAAELEAALLAAGLPSQCSRPDRAGAQELSEQHEKAQGKRQTNFSSLWEKTGHSGNLICQALLYYDGADERMQTHILGQPTFTLKHWEVSCTNNGFNKSILVLPNPKGSNYEAQLTRLGVFYS